MRERIAAFGGQLTAEPLAGHLTAEPLAGHLTARPLPGRPAEPLARRGFRVSARGPDRGRGVTTTVLVVDDQALLRTAFSSLIAAEDDLEVAGQAADGRQAVELAHNLAPDVVVMDVRMPVMDGIEATRHITATRVQPPASSSSPPSTWTSTSSRRCASARAASRSRAARWRSC